MKKKIKRAIRIIKNFNQIKVNLKKLQLMEIQQVKKLNLKVKMLIT